MTQATQNQIGAMQDLVRTSLQAAVDALGEIRIHPVDAMIAMGFEISTLLYRIDPVSAVAIQNNIADHGAGAPSAADLEQQDHHHRNLRQRFDALQSQTEKVES